MTSAEGDIPLPPEFTTTSPLDHTCGRRVRVRSAHGTGETGDTAVKTMESPREPYYVPCRWALSRENGKTLNMRRLRRLTLPPLVPSTKQERTMPLGAA